MAPVIFSHLQVKYRFFLTANTAQLNCDPSTKELASVFDITVKK